jgi:RES domain
MRKEVQEAIDNLKKLDLSKYPYYDITTNIASIGLIGHLEITLHPGKYVYRARVHDNDEHFYSKCQLTYKPQQYNKTCQRASTPNMTMFYGSVLPEEIEKGELDEVRVVPTFEASPWMRDKNSKGIKKITYSKWKVTQEIKVIAIIQHGNFYDKSSYTKKLMDEYEAFLSQSPDQKEETISFMSFMASEFAKEVDGSKDYDYLISAAFTETLVKNGCDGVLYPSVRLGGTGFNVAITPEAADQKLQLDVVMECTAYKLLDKTILDNELIATPYPNQTHFLFVAVEDQYHVGQPNCLKELGVTSPDSLK